MTYRTGHHCIDSPIDVSIDCATIFTCLPTFLINDELFPEKFYYVPLTKHKDANAFLEAGDQDDLKWAAVKPQRFAPENFFVGDIEVEKAIKTENPYEYVPTGHTGLDDKIRGLVKGGLTFIKALRGQGKTELIRYFEVGLLKSDAKIALLHMEEMKSTTLRAMATYHLGCNVRTHEDAGRNGYTLDQVEEAANIIADSDNNRTIIFESADTLSTVFGRPIIGFVSW